MEKIKSNSKDSSSPSSVTDLPPVCDSVDVVLPPSLFSSSGGECSVLVQVEPEDALVLDFEGSQGAIGRFEADGDGVVLDFKGNQYEGKIQPGPTAMVLAFAKQGFGPSDKQTKERLKVDSITDEFLTLTKTQDTMAKLDAVVKGKMDDGYSVRDENVNDSSANEVKNADQNKNNASDKKRDSSANTSNSTKKRKVAAKKKK
mmetsp:Transcript_21131/g.29853  ORF Transcript_21131/g.29853 Transcript_21131/m.29853 type:complete len:202 (-) Transcript_21131:33-638(-)